MNFQTETYCHLPKKQIPFRSPFEKRYCKSATSFQRNTLRKMQFLPTNECKEREIIYAAQCSKHKVLYIGHTGEQLLVHFSKHHHDTKNRPDKSEVAKYFHESDNLTDDLNVTILQNNIKTATARRYHQDKLICKLKILALHGLNTDIGDYAKEMCKFY